jgi:AmmeMemoRadiSam system protein B/AmmeMemoRadiSam system protein A
MNKKKIFFVSALMLSMVMLTIVCYSQEVRKSVWAGIFYEAKGAALSAQIDGFLRLSKGKTSSKEKPLAIISPHAGYMYSGATAACSYNTVRGKDYDTVVIIGPSHRYGFNGCSIYMKGGYETPLGVAEVDTALAAELLRLSGYKFIPQAHQQEHSIEVQIPFIQKVLPGVKILPVLMGFSSKKTIFTLAEALSKCLQGKKEKVLLVASTDMSHFLSKEKANKLDSSTISLIKSWDTDALIKKIERNENIMCGGGAVVSTLIYSRNAGADRLDFLQYRDSSAAGGSESEVVGYMAAAIYPKSPESGFTLSHEEKQELLRIAGQAVTLFVKEKKILEYTTQVPSLLEQRGAFVTLKKKGRLRGCIGFIEPVLPLYQTIIQAAIYAAIKDSRFYPVRASELKDIDLEISVLTPTRKIKDPNLIKVGKHGLVISKGNQKGLLLPQVPVENKWSRKTYLQQACLKAGLPKDAWKSGAEIEIFEAIVFH